MRKNIHKVLWCFYVVLFCYLFILMSMRTGRRHITNDLFSKKKRVFVPQYQATAEQINWCHIIHIPYYFVDFAVDIANSLCILIRFQLHTPQFKLLIIMENKKTRKAQKRTELEAMFRVLCVQHFMLCLAMQFLFSSSFLQLLLAVIQPTVQNSNQTNILIV